MQARHDDDEAFKPHADVDQNRYDEYDWQEGASLAEPEHLRDQHVAGHHGPIRPLEWPQGPVLEHKLFVSISSLISSVIFSWQWSYLYFISSAISAAISSKE